MIVGMMYCIVHERFQKLGFAIGHDDVRRGSGEKKSPNGFGAIDHVTVQVMAREGGEEHVCVCVCSLCVACHICR